MNLLLITQKADKNDPVLGFMHRWINEFSKRFNSITVICLEEGEHDFPENVKVLSLGKEEKQSRLQYLIHFYWYIIHERKNYDCVFVHMNQEYVLLGNLVWKILCKKITMWRNHYHGNFLTRIAVAMCDTVFCTSKDSYTAKFKKTVIMPVGIDTDNFHTVEGVSRTSNSILSLGRISPTKRVGVLIDSLIVLNKENPSFSASIYGDALPQDLKYSDDIKKKVQDENLDNKIKFHPAVKNVDTPAIYSAHSLFVNLTRSGSYDKTIFEATLCGCLVLASNQDIHRELGDRFFAHIDASAEDIARKINTLLSMDKDEAERIIQNMQEKVRTNHSLNILADKMFSILNDQK